MPKVCKKEKRIVETSKKATRLKNIIIRRDVSTFDIIRYKWTCKNTILHKKHFPIFNYSFFHRKSVN